MNSEPIFDSGQELTIRHSSWGLGAAGRTLAASTSRLINGQGDDVLILFDTRIPDQGSHLVFDRNGHPIEFTAVQNLFHELVHARHKLNGTWRYWDSEGQAVAEENIFRSQYAALQGDSSGAQRVGSRGEQRWWPAEASLAATQGATGMTF